MKLLFDLASTQPNNSGKIHGGGKYAIEVFRELVINNIPMECVYDSTRYIRTDLIQIAKDKNIKLHDISKISLDCIVKKGEISTFYTASTDLRRPLIHGVRNIYTVHGLRELEMPRDWMMLRYRSSSYQFIKTFVTLLANKWWKKVIYKRTKKFLTRDNIHFVTVSNHTKYSCISYIPELISANIPVCYSPSTSQNDHNVEPYSINAPYILLVSGNRAEKNSLRGIMAIDEIISEHSNLNSLKVIVTGAKGKNTYRYKFRNPNNFIFAGYVDEDMLDRLYCGATMLVYPSLNEGFGYPPLEAMHYGTPVIASALTSIAEVCGDAAIYCNPFDYKEIKGRILRLLDDKKMQKEYFKRGKLKFAEISQRQKEDLAKLINFLTN